nr:tetraacyldisaccharide 4'-kinase [Azospirillum picis]
MAAALLAPLGAIYGWAGRRRIAGTVPRPVGIPVVCVGNLVAGGAGKTPVGLALIAALRRRGVAVHALTRGHGGREAGPLCVDPRRQGAADVGDEALLLAAAAPCWVARDRLAGAERAAAAGAGAVVMDDGFQNPALRKDLALVVADGAVGFGNGRLVPAGPLRERVADGLARTDALVVVGEDRCGVAALAGGRPVLRARLVPDAGAAAALAGRDVLAFAGIGRPEKFFATLEALGARVVERAPFADHHPFRPAEIEALLARAAAHGALPVTTAKDAVRLPAALRERVGVLPVAVRWEEEGALDALLDRLPLKGTPHGEAA